MRMSYAQWSLIRCPDVSKEFGWQGKRNILESKPLRRKGDGGRWAERKTTYRRFAEFDLFLVECASYRLLEGQEPN
jgi:hypothetical protein